MTTKWAEEPQKKKQKCLWWHMMP